VNNLNKTLHAARFAAEKHTGHFRKGSRREPYINHPIEVANLIANVAMVDDEDILSAALLHDTVEDCDVSPEEITEKFGETTTRGCRNMNASCSRSSTHRIFRMVPR
jgi:guanosine-3',5'-bis(diphosphate) 3'-pyrophosphohydrolase